MGGRVRAVGGGGSGTIEGSTGKASPVDPRGPKFPRSGRITQQCFVSADGRGQIVGVAKPGGVTLQGQSGSAWKIGERMYVPKGSAADDQARPRGPAKVYAFPLPGELFTPSFGKASAALGKVTVVGGNATRNVLEYVDAAGKRGYAPASQIRLKL